MDEITALVQSLEYQLKVRGCTFPITEKDFELVKDKITVPYRVEKSPWGITLVRYPW